MRMMILVINDDDNDNDDDDIGNDEMARKNPAVCSSAWLLGNVLPYLLFRLRLPRCLLFRPRRSNV